MLPGYNRGVSVQRILDAVENGEPRASEELLALVYEELRKLAAHKMANEASGNTLQPTALVHEAWLRLMGNPNRSWNGRQHFFRAAAEAMRRILIDRARRRNAQRRGGGLVVEEFDEANVVLERSSDEILAVGESIEKLAREDPLAAELVKLRYFVGMTASEAAAALGISPRASDRLWAYARTWLRVEISGPGPN